MKLLSLGGVLAAGVLFGAGLVLSGMTDPAKVLGFLNLRGLMDGTWNPTLAFVMGGALVVTLVGYRLVWRCTAPLCGGRFNLPTARVIDRKLVLGAALFGAGWGLAGYCPGPVLASVSSLNADVWGFMAALILGMVVGKIVRI